MKVITVASSEIGRRFGQLRQGQDVLLVTHHGRETHALVPIEYYRESMTRPQSAEEVKAPSIVDVAQTLPFSVFIVRADETVDFVNRPFETVSGMQSAMLLGRKLYEAVPMLAGTMFQGYLARAMNSGEPCSFEQPSVFREGRWIRFEITVTGSVALILAPDITDDVTRNRLADYKAAILSAMEAHGEVGYVRINPRGVIDKIDTATCNALMLAADSLIGLPVTNLVPISHRQPFRETLERVLNGGDPERFATQMMRNDGTSVDLVGGIVEVRGSYGAEGAVLLLSLQQG